MAHGGLKDYKTHIANAVAAIDAERWAAAVREFGRAQASLDHERGRHRRASAEISIRLADVYKAAGKYHLAGRAASHAMRQLESCRSSPTLKAKALSALAIVAWNRRGPSPALPYFESGADVVRRMKRPSISQRITVLDNLGLAYHSVGRLAEALQVQRTSLELAQVHEAEAVTRIKRRLANTLQDGGHFLTAHKLLREVRPSKGAGAIEKLSWYNASALLAERRGDIRNAVLYYREAQRQFFRLRPPPAAYAAVLPTPHSWMSTLARTIGPGVRLIACDAWPSAKGCLARA